MNADSPQDVSRFHYVEPVASSRIRTFIEEAAPFVWLDLSRPGMGGPDNCLAAQAIWARHLANAGVLFELLGSQSGLGFSALGGYRLSTGELVDHHFLALGEELALFDPTAGAEHIGHTGETPLDAYVVADGTPFPEWRRRRLGQTR